MAGLRIIITLVVSLMAVQVQTFSGGAPEDTCDSLMPSHGVSEQNSPSPYKITTSATNVGSGQSIRVTLLGTVPFKGFMVRVRQNGAFIDGTFQETNDASLRCNGQGITHRSGNPKNNIAITFTTSPYLAPSPLTFVATVVQEKIKFWTEVTSAVVTVVASPSMGGNTNGVTQPTRMGGNVVGPGASAQSGLATANNGDARKNDAGMQGVTFMSSLIFLLHLCCGFHDSF